MFQGNAASDEKRRLEALQKYRVLDTPPEQALDELTALATLICEAPISLISLVDEQRQWFKSRAGLETTETPREFSFCAHALRQKDLLIVPDATRDARFAANPLVTGEPGIRFYAGAPLISLEGEVLGTLCVIDRVPRTLTAAQEVALRVLARQVMTHFELRRQALKLAKNERLLGTIINAEPECVKLLGADGRVQMMNRAGLRIVEAESFEQIAGKSVFPLIAEEHRAQFEDLTQRVFHGESGMLEFQLIGLHGTSCWLKTHAVPLRDENGTITAALGITRDITEHKQAETALGASELRYRRLFESAKDGILILDAETGRVVDVNPFLVATLGFTHEQFLGKAIWELGFFKDVCANEEKFAELRETEYVRYENLPLETIDGRQIDVEFVSNVYLVNGGKVIQCNVRDVTERKRAEDRVREQAAMLDQAHDAIIVRDIHTRRITFWNRGAERLYGWTAAEAVGRDIGELIFADSKMPDTITEELLRTGEWRGEYFKVTKAGKKLKIGGHATLLRDGDGAPKSVLVIDFDLTEQRQAEAQLLRAQRMESIGTLASGVAHDLNNILSPIMMSVPILRRDLGPAQRESIISTIEMSAERGAQIVKQVLTFGRGLEGDKRPLQVGDLIEELMKIMRETFPKSLSIESSIAPGLWPALGDSTQLHQVLLNLCVNARDAMPKGGRLRLCAVNLSLDASFASMVPEATPGPYLLIEVRDTGSGIPPEIVERIFDPFFTTKSVGNGTGLGLSTVLGIVKGHGGFLQVNTQLGKGTTFQVYLPASPDDHAPPASPARTLTPQGDRELVLVVDDEVSVRDAARLVLETGGYRVLAACDGTEALAVFAMNSGSIAAVLTDLMMPFMDGVACIRALRTMAPRMPIIASTGLGEKAQLAELKAMSVETILHKPYGADTLLRAIHHALHPVANSPTA